MAGDVSTCGATGVAIFDLAASSNNLAPGKYYSDIEWVLNDKSEHIIYNSTITIFNRVSDT